MKKIFILSILFFLNSFYFGQKTLRMGKHEYYIKKTFQFFLKMMGLMQNMIYMRPKIIGKNLDVSP